LWWPLLLCRAIVNGFHPTTHKVSLQAFKAIILSKTRPLSCQRKANPKPNVRVSLGQVKGDDWWRHSHEYSRPKEEGDQVTF